MKIIGITGTLGAGKGTIVDYLASHKGFIHYSVRAYLSDILIQRGSELNRGNMADLANELREQHGSSYIVEQLYKQAIVDGKNCIIESIRTPGEVFSLRGKDGFVLFSVDADPKIRYERIRKRKSVTDMITYEEFKENEAREMKSDDPHRQNIAACIAIADYSFDNNGTIQELYNQIETTLDEIRRKCRIKQDTGSL